MASDSRYGLVRQGRMFQVRLYAASASIRIRTLMGDASGRAPRTDSDTRILNTDAKTVADTNRDSAKDSTTKRVPKGCSQ
jgi:hypothetical protein